MAKLKPLYGSSRLRTVHGNAHNYYHVSLEWFGFWLGLAWVIVEGCM